MKLYNALKEYFDNATPEELAEDEKRLSEWENIGPSVDEYVEFLKKIGVYDNKRKN